MVMTTINPTGYCPNCKQNVLLAREDIDVGLAILLLIFTAGIGLIIYLVIYYSRPENRCVHCNTEALSVQSKSNYTDQKQVSYQSNENPYIYHKETDTNLESQNLSEGSTKEISEKINYCPLCGSKIDTESQKYCSNCGSQL
jgi:hypothetical protein